MGEDSIKAPLDVALLLPCYWPEVFRGAERIARELADGLLARGERPSLITSHPGRARRSVEGGLPVLRLRRPPQGPLARRQPYLTHVPLSYLALRSGSYHLAHALYPTDALAAARWARKTGRAAVLSYTGYPYPEWLSVDRWQREVLLRATRGCNAVVVLSDRAAAAMEDSIGHRPEVIYPGVDLGTFRPLSGRPTRPTLVCTAASDVSRKNVALLVDAFALVRRRYRDARLILVRPQDPAAARRAGVDLGAVGVQWIEHQSDPSELARVNAEASVAILPASQEAFGIVLVEALACGTPVVGFADGGIPEIIDRPEVGRLFGTLEPQALADAVFEVLDRAEDPETAARCRARAEQFSTELACERYLGLYHRLIDDVGPATRTAGGERKAAAAAR